MSGRLEIWWLWAIGGFLKMVKNVGNVRVICGDVYFAYSI